MEVNIAETKNVMNRGLKGTTNMGKFRWLSMEYMIDPSEDENKDSPSKRSILKKKGTQPQENSKITEEIPSFKGMRKIAESDVIHYRRKIGEFMNCMYSAIASIFTKKEKCKSRCELYGHIQPETWEGLYPKCLDCGTEITSSDMLRKAVTRS